MIGWIDDLLNRITMYRLVLYHLIFLVVAGLFVSAFGLVPFSPVALACSSVYLVAICWIVNWVFSKVFEAPTNVESVYITALILALIITPAAGVGGYIFLTWAAILAMASKYILAIHKKHLFNPAAVAMFITSLAINQSASWWVGTLAMLPFVLIGGVLVIRKQRQFAVVGLMVAVACITVGALSLLGGVGSLPLTIWKTIVESPLFFFASVMFTEPLTMPPTRRLQYVYATLVGILFAPQLHVGAFYTTPESALLMGNIFSYIVSPKVRRLLQLIEKRQLTPDTYNFAFAADRPFSFRPGQYMEWTLPHPHPDTRGNRRYFTLASSPTEPDIHLGVKFYPKPSSFKQTLLSLMPGSRIVAGQVAGDFVLPADPAKKCVFIAGGIGITPFRSMIKYLLDTNESRPITLLYSARTLDDFAYADIFEEARQRLGIETVYVPSDAASVPANWAGERGLITPALIQAYVPDYAERLFYLSGPRSMITAFERSLREMGVPSHHVKTDFFPGFV